MNREELQKRYDTVSETKEKLKRNQKLIIDCLKSNDIKDNDMKIVRWGYNQRLKMLGLEKQRILKKLHKTLN